jgi:branched-chain amino acid transport system permease protein
MTRNDLIRSIKIGLIAGVVATSVSAIGMIETFNERDIITDILTLGEALLFSLPIIAGFMSVPKRLTGEALFVDDEESIDSALPSGIQAAIYGGISGISTAVVLVGFIVLMAQFPGIRDSLPNVSPALLEILTFGQESVAVGSLMLAVVMVFLGVIAALFRLLPKKAQRPIRNGLMWSLGIGLLSEIILLVLINFMDKSALRAIFGNKGITLAAAVFLFVIAAVLSIFWESRGRTRYQRRRGALTEKQNKVMRQLGIAFAVFVMVILPLNLGNYLTEVLDIVGIFILMGLGLNIVVGFAGLLDLGYVAFFAIGAYMMALLTSTGDLGVVGFPFWVALPFCVLAATVAGIVLGVPVLRMRGDYLAIVTLGFGEIIRVLVGSDLMKAVLGGAQGILRIGRPTIPIPEFLREAISEGAPSFIFVQPKEFYYLILIGCLLAVFVSIRLRDARAGRNWMAMREDEDVAEAMGIHLVSTKLLAFAFGAAFGGLAGALFASRISSIFPISFQLLISINVLSLIIVGGIGSIPGVVVGALFLVGLPELLREFQEYRLLMYGALLIVMMLVRPEGLWPSAVRRRELHADEEDAAREGPSALDDVATLVQR